MLQTQDVRGETFHPRSLGHAWWVFESLVNESVAMFLLVLMILFEELHASWFNITTRNSAVLVDSHQKLNKLKVDDLPTVNVSFLAQDGYDRLRPTCYPETVRFNYIHTGQLYRF